MRKLYVMEKKKVITQKLSKLKNESGVNHDLLLAQPNQLLNEKNRTRMFNGMPSNAMQRAALMEMRHKVGNSAIQRALAKRADGSLQRKKGEEAKEGGEAETPKKENAPFNLDQWLSGEVYDLVKDQLSEAQLNKYAKDLAKKAGSLFLEQISGAESEANFIEKAQNKAFSDLFALEVQKAVAEILKTPAGRRLRKALINYGRQNPGAIIGLLLTGLAVMAATNQDIPKLDLQQKLGKGFQLKEEADLGKFQELALNKLKLGISYSKDKFEVGISGGYGKTSELLSMRGGKEQKPEKAEAKTNPSMTSAGIIDLNLKLKSIGFKTSALFAGSNKWMGSAEFNLGGKNNYFTPKLTYGSDEQLKFELGNQFVVDALTFASKYKYGAGEHSMSHNLKLANPFGTEGLKIDASVDYKLNNPKLDAFKLSGEYELQRKKSALVPVLIIKVEGKYQAGTPEKAPGFSGMVVLVGYM